MAAPWDPHATSFPLRKDLPKIPGNPDGSAWVWGKDDELGRLNLLTPERVAAAAKLIQTGEMVSLNLPLDVPKTPAFGREPFEHKIKVLAKGVFDDTIFCNPQSGSQWDGFRHFCHRPTGSFYNNLQDEDILGPKANLKCGIGAWSNHGIAGRAILLDFRGYAHDHGITYDPFREYPISYSQLVACGKYQGLDIRPAPQGGDVQIGDILLVRSGFVEAYHQKSEEEREVAAHRVHVVGGDDKQAWAGIKQEEEVLDWIHDCFFAAVAGDAPSWEAWPSRSGYILHEYVLAGWGVPIGEMWDLEKLAEKCKERKRWTFFVTSTPANVPGGVSSHANATAIF